MIGATGIFVLLSIFYYEYVPDGTFTDKDEEKIQNSPEIITSKDLKPENVLCVYEDSLTPVKLCDFDLGSGIKFHSGGGSETTPLLFTPVGSAEFMAPEV